MSLVVGIVVGGASFIGMAGLMRYGITTTQNIMKKIRQRKEKKDIKKRFKIIIENVNYTQFVNIMYEIKTYDNINNKNMLIKLKREYGFNDNHILSLNNFRMRFDINFDEKTKMLKEMIRREIELSISRLKDSGSF